MIIAAAIALPRPAAVDHGGLAGHKSALVAGQIDHQGGDLVGLGQAAHGLAGGEGAQGRFVVAGGVQALVQRGGIDGAGADRVAVNPCGQ